MADASYTAQVTKESKTNFYWSFLLLPKHRRQAIFDAYAFCRQADDIVDDNEPDEARRLLDDWRAGLDRCYDGNPDHPIFERLAPTVREFSIPKEHFAAIIDGCEMDLVKSRYVTFEELDAYCYNVASAVGLVCIHIFGFRNPASIDYAINLGKALQMTNIMRDVKQDTERDRVYLPKEDLERFKVPESDLFAGRYSDNFHNLMQFEYERAEGFYRAADERAIGADRWPLFPAEIMEQIYHRLLLQMKAADFNVFAMRPRVSNNRKAAIAFRIWLRARVRGVFS